MNDEIAEEILEALQAINKSLENIAQSTRRLR